MTAVYGLTVVHDFVCLLSVKKQKHAFFLFCSMLSGSIFSINLLAFYHKCRALIGYATHYYQNQYSGKTALGILNLKRFDSKHMTLKKLSCDPKIELHTFLLINSAANGKMDLQVKVEQ